jgi:hypothetical protein
MNLVCAPAHVIRKKTANPAERIGGMVNKKEGDLLLLYSAGPQ